jgi:hypothetical protein
MIRRHTNNENLLEMAHVVHVVHQVSNLSKKGVQTNAMTIVTILPCLHVDPKKTPSHGFFVVSIDFLGSVDWSTKDHGQSILCEKTYNLCLSSRMFIQELARIIIIITKLHNMLFNLFDFNEFLACNLISPS